MATYISDDPKLLDELFRKDGEGQLLVGYETGKEKPHAESSYMLYPANPDRQDPVYTFMALFSQQSIKAKYSAFVPNTRLEIYSFPKMTDVPAISGDISKKEYINQVLLPYIREKGLAPLISTNLRNVLFAQSRSDILMISGELPKLTTQQLDELVHFHQKQDELAARYDYNPVYKLPLHAVETSKGILFFSDTKMGREGLKSFYQQLSGNYFWVHGEPGPVRQYNVNCLSDDICPLVDACYRKNPQSGKGEYDFDNAVFSKEAFRDRKQWKLAFETDMEPSASEFLRLNEFAGCPASRNNADISKLLYLMENGFKRDIINDPDFGYRNVFQEYVTRIDDCINGQSSGPDLSDVLDDMRWKAKNILLTDFDVRGHRTLERTLNDRSVPFLINGTDAGEAMRQALLEGKWIYCPQISKSMPDLHFLHAEKTCNRVMAYTKSPVNKTVYQEKNGKYSINSLVYWVTYVHNVVYSFYRSMIYCYINSTQRCAGSIVIDIIPTNGADKRKFFPFAPYFPVTNVIKRYFYPYFPAIIGIKGYSFPYFPYLSGIMKIKTALYSLFSRLDWHKTVVFPCLGEIYEGIRSLSWEIPVT